MKEIREFLAECFPTMLEIDKGYFGDAKKMELYTPKGQADFKRYISYLTEEVAEIYDTRENPSSTEATLDEVADVLGFLHVAMGKAGGDIELYDPVMVFQPKVRVIEVEGQEDRTMIDYPVTGTGMDIRWRGGFGMQALDESVVKSILFTPMYEAMMLTNLLKNRAWKKENYTLDVTSFNIQLKKTYNAHIRAIFKLGFSLKDIQAAFQKKTSTNLKRIKENY